VTYSIGNCLVIEFNTKQRDREVHLIDNKTYTVELPRGESTVSACFMNRSNVTVDTAKIMTG
jgi:hypothetical protein